MQPQTINESEFRAIPTQSLNINETTPNLDQKIKRTVEINHGNGSIAPLVVTRHQPSARQSILQRAVA